MLTNSPYSSRDHLRVGLEAALVGDQIDELGAEVDVGLLERAGDDAAVTARVGWADQRFTGVLGLDPAALARAFEAVDVCEVGRDDLARRRRS